jgi:hypothetical protein
MTEAAATRDDKDGGRRHATTKTTSNVVADAMVAANVVVDVVAATIVVVDAAALIAEVGVVASTTEVDAGAVVIDGVRGAVH